MHMRDWYILAFNINKWWWFLLNLQILYITYVPAVDRRGVTPLFLCLSSLYMCHKSDLISLFCTNRKFQVVSYLHSAAWLHFTPFPAMIWLLPAIGLLFGRFHAPSFQTCVLSHCTQACNAAREGRTATMSARSDAVSTSDWRPSHSLFPIKTFCQARKYKRQRVKDEGRDSRRGRQTDGVLVEK